ncbi:MAG: ureidoglycolate lyase [Rhizobiaceae bacterium]|nr:ureidoglycolate lyase [Rhizobiaceae bacterium]
MNPIIAKPLTRAAFAPYGEVIEMDGAHHYPINGGMAERFHDLARVEAAGPGGRVLVSLFRGQPYALPLALRLVERHPFGSQAFFPLQDRPWLVIVARDGEDGPGVPEAFVAQGNQGVNYPRNQWHGVLTPFGAAQDFIVIDRGGEGANLEEFTYPSPFPIAVRD